VQDIERTIVAFVCDELELRPEDFTGDTNLRELPGAESVKVLRVIARIERTYDCELDDEIVFRVETVRELVNAVSELTRPGP
jgi:acyl carrier protein